MWRTHLIAVSMALAAFSAPAQESAQSYGPFDAVAEGSRNDELRRLSLIDSQLDQIDRLRSLTVPVAGPRLFLRDPGVSTVYGFGRRGILGLRPQGYVVVRRAPVVVYRRSYVVQAPPPPPSPIEYGAGEAYGYSSRQAVRQPIGHESLQTGADRWEYRPLYADDDQQLDQVHRDIERTLNEPDATDLSARRSTLSAGNSLRSSAAEPEELPVPDERDREARDIPTPPRATPASARDIAREAEANSSGELRRQVRVPPRPQADPPDQGERNNSLPIPRSASDARENAEVSSAELQPSNDVKGPLLQNPATGGREF